MKIIEYDDIDPIEVLHLNLIGLDFSLTPERVKLIRQYDERVFPFFALYAVENGIILGQVGVFRLPMVSDEGLEDVGGVWAVCTHPAYRQRGVATQLLKEAHDRMRSESLRFSTLGTSMHRIAHLLYKKQGYKDVFHSASILLSHRNILKTNDCLYVEQADFEKLNLTDDLFRQVSVNRLGFAHRFENFIPAMVAIGEIALGSIEEKEIWLIWKDNQQVGYLIVKQSRNVLKVVDILLTQGVSIANVISSLVRKVPKPYIQVKSNHRSVTDSLLKLGAQVILQDWSTFMMKPLTPEAMKIDPKSLFGFNTDRFLFSWMDST